MRSLKNNNAKIVSKESLKEKKKNDNKLNEENIISEIINVELFEKNSDIKKKKLSLLNSNLNKINNEKKKKISVKDKNDSFNYFPNLNDPDFNYNLLKKKEFITFYEKDNYPGLTYSEISDLKCSTNKFKTFELSNSQKFLKTFISPETPYNSILLIHGTGVGKTCAAISIAEQFIPYIEKNGQRIIILASGQLGKQFLREVFDTEKYLDMKNKDSNYKYSGCTGNTYLNLIEKQNINNTINNNDIFRKEMKKIKKQRYQEFGYEMFANRVEDLEKNATIYIPDNNHKEIEIAIKKAYQDHFSNTIIIVDEVQNLKTISEDTKTKKITSIFQKIIENVENIKLIMLSATPMFNQASEIIYLLNLMLKNDRRPTINKSDFFDKYENIKPESENRLLEISKGYISYIRGQNPYNFPFRLSPSINNDPNIINFNVMPKYNAKGQIIPDDEKIKYLEIIGDKMSDFQYKIYNENSNINLKDIDLISASKDDINLSSNDFLTPRQTGTMVYPTELYNLPGLKSCFEFYNSEVGPFKYHKSIINKYGYFLKRDLIGTYSCKFKSILDYIFNSTGPVFIYTEWIKSGVIPLALILEQNGFLRFNNFPLLDENCPKISYTCKYENEYKNLKDFKQAYYAIYTGSENLSGDKENLIKNFKDINNIDGKLIKVIIVTVAGSEGIDLSGIREVHICDPWWNLNRIEQIIGRSIRNCSHSSLEVKDRNVTVYLHSAIPSKKKDQEIETIDLYMYRRAFKKQIEISKVEDILKRGAIDCNINKNINSFPVKKINTTLKILTSQKKEVYYQVGDKSYSSVCNYKKNCDYKCDPQFEITDQEIDKSTYIEYFAKDIIPEIKNKIIDLFLENQILTINQIIDLLNKNSSLKETDNLYKYLALTEIIKNKDVVTDQFNRKGTIKYQNLYYYFFPNLKFDKKYLNLSNNGYIPITYKDKSKVLNKSLIPSKKSMKNDINEYQRVIDVVLNEYNDYLNRIKNKKIYLDENFWSDKQEKISRLIYEIIIDSLKDYEREILIQKVLIDQKNNTLEIDPLIYQALSFYLIKDSNSSVTYYYTFDNKEFKFYSLNPNFDNQNNLDEDKLFISANNQTSERLIKILRNIKKKYSMNLIYGFIQNSNFKIVNNIGVEKNSTGVVCNNVDKPPIIHSINYIVNYDKYLLDGSIKKNKVIKKHIKIQKNNLCIELQLLLRYLENYGDKSKKYFFRDYNLNSEILII